MTCFALGHLGSRAVGTGTWVLGSQSRFFPTLAERDYRVEVAGAFREAGVGGLIWQGEKEEAASGNGP